MGKMLCASLLILFLASCAASEKVIPAVESTPTAALPDTVENIREDIKTRPLLSILPFQREEDNIAAVLSSAALNSIDLNIRITGRYDISDRFTEADIFSAGDVRDYCYENEIDNAVFGEIIIDDGVYTITYSIYDTASENVSYSGTSSIDNVLDIFDAADEISGNILSKLSDTPLTFGTLDIRTDSDEISQYRALLNEVEIPISGSPVKLISGEYDLKIIDINSQQALLSRNISIMEKEKTIVEFLTAEKELQRVTVILPFRTIKIDGRKEDWEGIEPLFTDAADDNVRPSAGKGGYDITAGYVCRDGEYIYWRMDFADGKPALRTSTEWHDKYVLTIGNYGKPVSDTPFWNFSEGYDLEIGRYENKYAARIWSQHEKKVIPGGKFRAGHDFIEAGFKLSILKDFDHDQLIQAWMRIIRLHNRSIWIDQTFRRRIIIGKQ